jgi:hypothetical protein
VKTTIRIKTALLVLLAAALLATASGPAQAKKPKREPIERFRTRAFNLDRGAVTDLDIVIYEWTTPEERQALLQTFAARGSKAFYAALHDVSEKGTVKAPQTLGYVMQYAWQVEVEGKRHIVLATNRPMGFLEVPTDFSFSLVVLDVDPETGQGEGSATGVTELSFDRETGQLQVRSAGAQPTMLKQVKTVKPKKKGK